MDFEFFSKSSLEVGSILHQPLFFAFGLEAIDELEVLEALDSLDSLDSLDNLDSLDSLENLSIFL